MAGVLSAFTCLCLIARIHVAISLSKISHQPPVTNKSPYKSVLILGSSPDRYALSDSYWHQTFKFKKFPFQHNAVFDKLRNVGIAVLQHPGVGLHGDLDEPFWNPSVAHALANKTQRPPGLPGTTPESVNEKGWSFAPTWKIIQKAPEFVRLALGETVDLVVVETSLWDLAGWWMNTGHVATPERIKQWCEKDLPYLLKNVTDTFSQSRVTPGRVVFRTAPQAAPWNQKRWTQANIEAMHECVARRSADGAGKVFENVGVIDYHEIMDKLIASTEKSHLPDLWRPDGYHPSHLPGRLYINEILRLLDVQPLEAPDVRSGSFDGEREEAFVEDEDDF